MANDQNTFAFMFDSGNLGSSFYGEVVFEHIIVMITSIVFMMSCVLKIKRNGKNGLN